MESRPWRTPSRSGTPCPVAGPSRPSPGSPGKGRGSGGVGVAWPSFQPEHRLAGCGEKPQGRGERGLSSCPAALQRSPVKWKIPSLPFQHKGKVPAQAEPGWGQSPAPSRPWDPIGSAAPLSKAQAPWLRNGAKSPTWLAGLEKTKWKMPIKHLAQEET